MPFIVLAIVLTTQPCAGDGKWSRLIASGLSQTELYAMRPPNIFYHNVGLLRVMVTNVGVIGNPSDDVGSFSADILGERAPTSVGAHSLTIMRMRETENLDDLMRYRLLAQGAHIPDSTDVASDYCLLLSVGPFSELLPGEEVEFQVALVAGLGWKGLLANAIEIKKVYRGKWRDADNDRHTGCDGHETCLPAQANDEPFWWSDPCVVSGTRRRVSPGTCEDPADWVDNDCDCCTPPQPRSWDCEGLETLVPWVGALAPPTPTVSTNDPAMRARAEGNRSIYLEWDNYWHTYRFHRPA